MITDLHFPTYCEEHIQPSKPIGKHLREFGVQLSSDNKDSGCVLEPTADSFTFLMVLNALRQWHIKSCINTQDECKSGQQCFESPLSSLAWLVLQPFCLDNFDKYYYSKWNFRFYLLLFHISQLFGPSCAHGHKALMCFMKWFFWKECGSVNIVTSTTTWQGI